MIKRIKENASFLKIALIFFILILVAGIYLYSSFKRDRNNQIEEHNYNRINYFESLYRSKKNQINFSLLVAERIVTHFVIHEKGIEINNNDTITKKLYSNEKSQASYYTFPKISIAGNAGLEPDQFLNRISYISNFEISFWIQHKEGFVRAASSVLNDNSIGYYSQNTEFIQEIQTGKKVTQSETNDYGSKLIRYIPWHSNGKVKGFFRIIIIDSFISSSNIGMFNEEGFVCILKNDGTPFFEKFSDQKPENTSVIYSEMISNKGSDKTLKTEDYTAFYQYYPQDALTFAIIYKTKELKKSFTNYKIHLTIVLSVVFIVGIFVFYIYYKREKARKHRFFKKVVNIFSLKHNIMPKDELSVYQFINDYFNDINRYVRELKSGNYEVSFSHIDEDNEFRNNLAGIHNDLLEKTSFEKEREKENEFQKNLSKGSTQIIEVLQYFSDLKELSFKIVKSIADFLKFNQGALFILIEKPDSEPVLEMMASYAFGKQRFSQKVISLSEGLTGRAFFEKESIYMTDLPADYHFIESGFGEQQPSSLLIVPLIFNNKVQAVIELTSINTIEEYKIKFLERIGENIASTIANIKHTLQTEELLEKTRIQSLEIEEQRKTLEEKINTHRNQNRKLDKEILQLIEIIESVKSITYMIEYDLDGIIVDVSGKTMELFGAKKQDLLMIHHKKLISDSDYDEKYANFWDELLKNKNQSLEETLIFNNREFRLLQNYVPIRNVKRKIYRFLSVGTIIKN
jgi:PAS domain-containing protein